MHLNLINKCISVLIGEIKIKKVFNEPLVVGSEPNFNKGHYEMFYLTSKADLDKQYVLPSVTLGGFTYNKHSGEVNYKLNQISSFDAWMRPKSEVSFSASSLFPLITQS